MLRKFEVSGFKNFKDNFVLDFTKVKNYDFNKHLVDINSKTLRAGCIFGKNSSGKSNLGFALFDIVNHLTDDKEKTASEIAPYLNLDSNDKALFRYEFLFDEDIVEYYCEKTDPLNLKEEKLIINGEKVAYYDYISKTGDIKFSSSQNLTIDNLPNNLSIVKYIKNNSILDNEEFNAFNKFYKFVENMLLFYSLNTNRYFGYTNITESIEDAIIKEDKLNDFEDFLNNLDIKCKLTASELNGKYIILNNFEEGTARFFITASTGTKALALFYYWLIKSPDVSLIFMDEFDAYYHYELSNHVVNEIVKRRPHSQIIFTSHNINLMNNELLRPDCILLMRDNGIYSFSDLTKKELRYAHNLQKLYRSGAFNE